MKLIPVEWEGKKKWINEQKQKKFPCKIETVQPLIDGVAIIYADLFTKKIVNFQ